MKTRKLAITFALAALIAIAVPAAAHANFAIHGNYVADTDACAGCHRAHTSISTITWDDGLGNGADSQRSALLVSSATEMYEFCYACHDATGQGADTNVQEGVYEGTLYGESGGVLNGGGTETMEVYNPSLGVTETVPVTSEHEFRGSSWGAFGGGYSGGAPYPDGQILGVQAGESVDIKMDCGTCHDPHGSPNYRILKTRVNGNQVGKYGPGGTAVDPDPDGWVASVEEGWPTNGFRLHTAYPNYVPDYTSPQYAKGYDVEDGNSIAPERGMSGWCAGCHQTYLRDAEEFVKSDGTTYTASASVYNAGDGGGLRLRHRHPINVPLSNYDGPDKSSMIITDSVLPLAHDLDVTESGNNGGNESSDWIDCLTCHRAHGTAASMAGYASNTDHTDVPAPTTGDGALGSENEFPGDGASFLLRQDNRGVCESCHNK